VQIWLFWCGGQGSRLYPGELTAVDSVGRPDPGRPRPGRDAADLVRRIVEGSTSPDSNHCLPWPGRRIGRRVVPVAVIMDRGRPVPRRRRPRRSPGLLFPRLAEPRRDRIGPVRDL